MQHLQTVLANDPILHDSQLEINKYYINYIDESSIQTELKALNADQERTSIYSTQENSCRLEVSELVEEVISVVNTSN